MQLFILGLSAVGVGNDNSIYKDFKGSIKESKWLDTLADYQQETKIGRFVTLQYPYRESERS